MTARIRRSLSGQSLPKSRAGLVRLLGADEER